jgi:hypothetical protein
MKTFSKIAAAALAIAASTPAFAGAFWVENGNNRHFVSRVWYAPTYNGTVPYREIPVRNWIAPGWESRFTMDNGYCYQNVIVRFSDGYEQKFTGVDVCQGRTLVAR